MRAQRQLQQQRWESELMQLARLAGQRNAQWSVWLADRDYQQKLSLERMRQTGETQRTEHRIEWEREEAGMKATESARKEQEDAARWAAFLPGSWSFGSAKLKADMEAAKVKGAATEQRQSAFDSMKTAAAQEFPEWAPVISATTDPKAFDVTMRAIGSFGQRTKEREKAAVTNKAASYRLYSDMLRQVLGTRTTSELYKTGTTTVNIDANPAVAPLVNPDGTLMTPDQFHESLHGQAAPFTQPSPQVTEQGTVGDRVTPTATLTGVKPKQVTVGRQASFEDALAALRALGAGANEEDIKEWIRINR